MDPSPNDGGNLDIPALPSDDTRPPESAKEAKLVLDRIRLDRGFLSTQYEEELLKTSLECQDAVRKVAETARRKTIKYTNSIAGELYSSKDRFMYELLQNADDSIYPNGAEPCLTINLYPDKFVYETNEVGFTIANVKAVCDTGESSKKLSADDRSIGEKGYGFKSVFAVATRARIQSGHWSFYFEHREGDDGLGMITPQHITPDILPTGVTTRIELLLQDDPSDLFDRLSKALMDLHETTIFFLQRISRLVVNIYHSDGPRSCSSIRKKLVHDPSIRTGQVVSLTKDLARRISSEPMITREKRYCVLSKIIAGMPADKHRKDKVCSEIQLAFPFDPDTKEPVFDTDGEHVFAYLPLYRKPFLPFLIQGDFITSNSRESVLDCAWNQRLLTGTAELFCDAARSFCGNNVLRYQWPKYLPVDVSFGFEKPLFQMIRSRLQDAAVFESWSSRKLVKLSQVKIVPQIYIHQNEPLVPDLPEEIYLAPGYENASRTLLERIGMQTMSQQDFVQRLSYDLKTIFPKLHLLVPSDPWYLSLCTALTMIISKPDNPAVESKLRSLKLIKLRRTSHDGQDTASSGEWISSTDVRHNPVYFPECTLVRGNGDRHDRDSVTVPYGLGMRIVDSQLLVQPRWQMLLRDLGVRNCLPKDVISSIHSFHSIRLTTPFKLQISQDTIVSHLRFLFWLRTETSPIKECLEIPDEGGFSASITTPRNNIYHYFHSENPHDMWNLLQDLPLPDRRQHAQFIDPALEQAEKDEVRRNSLSWKEWLEKCLLIKKRPPLIEKSGASGKALSSVLQRVLKDHPEKFVPTLQAHWSAEYGRLVEKNPEILSVLRNTEVPCMNGNKSPLEKAYLATRGLKSAVESLSLQEHVPFVKGPELINMDKWSFLIGLGVGHEVNTNFYLDLLTITRRIDGVGKFSTSDVTKKLYSEISKCCNFNEQSHIAQKLAGIYVPDNKPGQQWRQIAECLWDAPSCITVKSPLMKHYSSDSQIKVLFCTYLKVGNVHVNDFLDQLRYFKKNGLDPDGTKISTSACKEIYEELYKHEPSIDVHTRQVIEKEKLIFANDTWHSPAECLWSTESDISDRISIARIYTTLKPFFVNQLLVKTLTTTMLVSELKMKSRSPIPLTSKDAKEIIFKINTLLPVETPNEERRRSFENLRGCQCFPVRQPDGDVVLRSSNKDFAIDNHERFSDNLRGKAYFLDFNRSEVQKLRPFLEAAGLTDRYLSDVVKETSEVRGNPTRSELLSTQLQSLAYSLFCCAVQFQSDKIVGEDPTIYQQLLTMEVYKAAELGTWITIIQDASPISILTSRSLLKLHSETSPWKIYVPNSEADRETCYMSQLPEVMSELLGVSGTKAVYAIPTILRSAAQGQEKQDKILEAFDIERLTWVSRPETIVPPRPSAPSPSTRPTLSPPITPFGKAVERPSTTYPYQQVQPSLFLRPTASITPGSTPATTPSRVPSHLGAPFGSSLPETPRPAAPVPRTPASSSSPSNFDWTPVTTPSVRSEAVSSTLFATSPAFRLSSRSPSPRPATNRSHRRAVSATPAPVVQFTGFQSLRIEGLENSGSSDRRRATVTSSPRFGFEYSTPQSSRRPTIVQLTPQQQKYRVLLDKIIRRVTGDNRTWDFNDLINALPVTVGLPLLFDKDEIFGVRSEDHLAHDMKIGAAGELFVIEKLIAAGLPGFGRNNWLSTIRKEVKVHERYEGMPDESPNMPTGSRAEPADILYPDPNGKFVEYLKTQDCIGLEDWLLTSRVPNRRFFIEVKTTTQGCDAVFHMSKGQHSRMLEMRKKKNVQPNDVYIICRVYNLLSNDINMRFYVSPGRDAEAQDFVPPTTNGQATATSSLFGFGPGYLMGPFGQAVPVEIESKAILKFTSKGFEVRPAKNTSTSTV